MSQSDTASGSRRAETTFTVASQCVNPVRLRGFYQRIAARTGEVLTVIGSQENGDAILLVSCKDRRASCCPACSRLYEKDAYHLIAAGLRGGKSVPASVSDHPVIMLTLTAPSFGVIHGNRDRTRPCKCGRHHDPDDPQIGTPVDPARYRYVDQVIWNHYAPELWKRTVQGIRRGLAQVLGIRRSKLPQVAQIRFAKVAEFQRRGVVHYHAIVRIDGPAELDDPPPVECTSKLLEQLAHTGVEAAAVVLPDVLREVRSCTVETVRWGPQREIVTLDRNTCTTAAGYVAKYATKATETVTRGTLIKPIRSPEQLAKLSLSEHTRTLITAAWHIGAHTDIEAFNRWAHQFGYGGHTLTKSRYYSTTFLALRAARACWREGASDASEVIVRARLAYAGRGRGPRSTTALRSTNAHRGKPAPERSKP